MTTRQPASRQARVLLLSALLALLTTAGMNPRLCAEPQAGKSGPALTTLENEELYIHKVTDLGAALVNTNTIDWSGPNNRILVDKKGLNQYYNVFSVTPEGFRLKPLTLEMDPAGTARQHSGNASWFPSGEYFVFTSQNRSSTDYRRSIPGMGWHCNLWLANKDGTKFWQLTNLRTSYSTPKGVAMPHFSPDGKRLFWSGNTGKHTAESPWEQRALYMADFTIIDGRPKLTDIQEFQPGKQRDFYESYGFSPDGKKIYFAGNLDENQPWYGMNLYSLKKGDDQPKALTRTPNAWDRFAAVSPDGRKLVWSSSASFDIRHLGAGGSRWARYLKTELWIMNADGSDPKQLTHFNTPNTMEYVGRRTFVGASVWGPDGRQIAVVLHYESRNYDVESKVVILTLGKGPLEEKNKADKRNKKTSRGKRARTEKKKAAPKITPALPKW